MPPYDPKTRKFWGEYWKKQKRASSLNFDKFPKIVDFFHEHLPRGRNTVLEIGCGPGELKRRLESKDPHMDIIGIDLDPGSMGHLDGKYVRGTAEALPFKDNTFDAVYSSFTLTYTETEKAVREMWRVLKPESKAILILHSHNSLLQLGVEEGYNHASSQLGFRKRDLKNNVGKIDEIKERIAKLQGEVDEYAPLVDAMNKSFRTPDEARRFFEDYGFRVEHSAYIREEGKGVGPPIGIKIVLKKANGMGKWEKRMREVSRSKGGEEVEPQDDDMSEEMITFMGG